MNLGQGLGGDSELTAIAGALGRLVDWGNLRADPDTSRVTTVDDFHRARFLYQLTQRGEAVEETITSYDEALGRRGALQAVALIDIATQLRALWELAGQPEPEPAKVYLRKIALGPLRFLVGRGIGGYAENIQRMGFDSDDLSELSDRLVDELVAWGDTDAVTTRIDEHLTAGADQVVVHVLHDGDQPGPIEVARKLASRLIR
jgi:Protein of unknown function (DUF2397)